MVSATSTLWLQRIQAIGWLCGVDLVQLLVRLVGDRDRGRRDDTTPTHVEGDEGLFFSLPRFCFVWCLTGLHSSSLDDLRNLGRVITEPGLCSIHVPLAFFQGLNTPLELVLSDLSKNLAILVPGLCPFVDAKGE